MLHLWFNVLSLTLIGPFLVNKGTNLLQRFGSHTSMTSLLTWHLSRWHVTIKTHNGWFRSGGTTAPTRSQAVARIADRTASQHLRGHMTSSVTWPFDSPYAISYWWSFGTECLNSAVFEILRSKRIGVISLTFTWPFKVTWRHRSRDHSIAYMPFPIGGPLEPCLYP